MRCTCLPFEVLCIWREPVRSGFATGFGLFASELALLYADEEPKGVDTLNNYIDVVLIDEVPRSFFC